jgi:1,4-alpha-glucan branching enzyme
MVKTLKAKSVEFKFFAPSARKVSIAGTFNKWKADPARKDSRGNWSTKLSLTPGRHEYKFIVDGNWVNDPRCLSCIPNSFGSQNCVVEVK